MHKVNKSITKNLFIVVVTNLLVLAGSLISGFLIPGFLSIEDYASFKTFTLFVGYLGLLHLGFIDGIYIKYGGKNEVTLDKNILNYEHRFLLLFQLSISLFLLIIGFLFGDFIIIGLALMIIPVNIKAYFSMLFQAIFKFKEFSRITVLLPIIQLFFNLFLIFFLKKPDYRYFIVANIISFYIVFIYIERTYKEMFLNKIAQKIDSKILLTNFKKGIFIMSGSFLSIILFSIDRLFIKTFLSVYDFAVYSFAASLMVIINIMIKSVSLTFFPYIADGMDDDTILNSKKYLLIITTIFTSSYFVFSYIIRTFLSKYDNSLGIIAILFIGFPIIAIINSIYLNLYKIRKRPSFFFMVNFIVLLLSISLNVLVIIFIKKVLYIAIANTLTFYIWYFYSSRHFHTLNIGIFEIIYYILYISLFYTCFKYLNEISGFFIYLTFIIIINFVFYKKEFIEILSKVSAFIKINKRGVT